jgi:peptidoglycan/xylan/chitin deacetylase (PgdA/CDA1 family)
LTNLHGGEVISNEVNFRGQAQFSNLKSGTYVAKVTPNEDNLWPELNLQIIGSLNEFNIFKIQNEKIDEQDVIPNEIESCNCVAFRFDDVQDYWLNDVQFMNVFVEREIPLTIGIIGDSFGNDVKLLDFINENHKNSFEIASHGIGNTPFTEFSKEEQDIKLKQSVQSIEDKLKITPKVFVPPQNRFKENTVFVGVSHDETLSDTLEGLERYGFAVIVSHPQEFSKTINGTYVNEANISQISELEKLVDKIQESKIKIVSINQINIDSQNTIPPWIKNNAGWWAEGTINDETFVQGIQYLVQERIIIVSEESQIGSNEQIVPSWIKNNAGWWAEGTINDETFVQGIEFLVKNGIIIY